MLTVDSKARADMTEVILCLSAVYSGRPLPPRKKPSRSSKSDEKDDDKKEDTKIDSSTEERVGTYRTDAQGYQENLYDPTKATEGKKLASNSVAARRKRAAASSAGAGPAAVKASTAAATLGPTPSAPSPSAADPLAFSNLQGADDDAGTDVAFSSDFAADLKGFDSKGDGFFSAFDDTKGEPLSSEGDAFDATAFDASVWLDSTTPSKPASTQQLKDLDSKPTGEAQEIEEADNVDPTTKDTSDPQRKNSRRRREGGGRRSSYTDSKGVEVGIESISINDAENGAGDVERKERRSRTSKSEEERRQRARSSSRSKRKARQRDPRLERPEEGAGSSNGGDVERKPPKKGNSMRNPFSRKQTPA
jgi:hypothetical protein